MWKYLLAVLVVLAVAGAVFLLFFRGAAPLSEPAPDPVPEPIAEEPEPFIVSEVIGTSVQGRPIEVHRFGTGETDVLFVGGIHGGYEWNSSLLAYEYIDLLSADPTLVPVGMTISVIPDLNPDGTALVTGTTGRFTVADVPDPSVRVAAGRFNANDVDLNRNFDCKWAPESTWRGEVVSAGTGPFSEPEAAALRDYVLATAPSGVIFWHSQANNVYASECYEGPLPQTLTLMEAYAEAAGYGAVPSFDAYPITGDAEGWLASIGIPAITVELESFRSIEWERNLAGIEAALTTLAEDAALAR